MKPKTLPRPPEINEFVKHAIALRKAVEHIHEHWIHFKFFIKENFRDEVMDREVQEHFTKIKEAIDCYARFLNSPLMDGEDYDQCIAVMIECVDYIPVEELHVICGFADRAYRLKPADEDKASAA